MTPKKPRKPKVTTRSRVKAAIRLLWLQSPERARVLKADNYCCSNCGIKQSKAKGKEVKLNVHHTDGIDWDHIVELILRRVFKAEQVTLCEKCHKETK